MADDLSVRERAALYLGGELDIGPVRIETIAAGAAGLPAEESIGRKPHPVRSHLERAAFGEETILAHQRQPAPVAPCAAGIRNEAILDHLHRILGLEHFNRRVRLQPGHVRRAIDPIGFGACAPCAGDRLHIEKALIAASRPSITTIEVPPSSAAIARSGMAGQGAEEDVVDTVDREAPHKGRAGKSNVEQRSLRRNHRDRAEKSRVRRETGRRQKHFTAVNVVALVTESEQFR